MNIYDICNSRGSGIFSKSYHKASTKLQSQNMNRRDFLPMVLLSWYFLQNFDYKN